jgi:hypothetical protein
MLRPPKNEEFNELVHRTFPSSPRSKLDDYATSESVHIEHPPVQGRTSHALVGTSPPLSTLDSYATPGFKGIEEEGKRADAIAKAKKKATQTQAAPPRVREASPKAISPTDADLTLADVSGVDVSGANLRDTDLSVPGYQGPAVPAFQGPAVPAFQGPAVPAFQGPAVPAFQGPAFPVPAFQGPAFHVPAFQGPAFPVPAFQGPASK